MLRSTQVRLAQRWVHSPLLRQLLFEVWFRVAVIGLFLLVLFLALFLPRIWKMTPPGFLPVIRISGLDLVESWSLARSARRAAVAGRIDDASYRWQAAVAYNTANPDLIRGALQNLLQTDPPNPAYLGPAAGLSAWLLRLTGTNQSDMTLAARVYERYRLYDYVVQTLRPFASRLAPLQEASYVKALFYLGQVEQFASLYAGLAQPELIDPELPLFYSAYLAGWGPPGRMAEGQRQLTAGLKDPARRIAANRLALAANWQLLNAIDYSQSLQRLEQWHADSVLDHIVYWRLLVLSGRKAEAKELALAYPYPPTFSVEAIRLAEAYVQLELPDYARKALQRYGPQFASAAEIWVIYANLLIEGRKWDDLRALAIQIRQQPGARESLTGYSFFLEGRATLAVDGHDSAASAFSRASRYSYENKALALRTAAALMQFGFPENAGELLLKIRKDFEWNLDYWHALFSVAFALKQPALLLESASKAFQLEPNNLVSMNNYAAALLINRQRPAEAIKLTLQLFYRQPDSSITKINHSFALLLNHRPQEADSILSTIDSEGLTPLEACAYFLGRFETALALQQFDQARRSSQRIDPGLLFPSQIKRLEESRRQLPATTAAKT